MFFLASISLVGLFFARSESGDDVETASIPENLAFVDTGGKSVGEPLTETAARTLVDGEIGWVDESGGAGQRNFALREAGPATAVPVESPDGPLQQAQSGSRDAAIEAPVFSESGANRAESSEAVAGPPGRAFAPTTTGGSSSPAPAGSVDGTSPSSTDAPMAGPPNATVPVTAAGPSQNTPSADSASTSQAPATPNTTTPPATTQPSTTTAPPATTRPTSTTAPSPSTTAQVAASGVIHVRAGSSGDGSPERPLGSIRDAIARVRPGETVLVHGGTYPGFEITKSGRAGAWITVEAVSGERVLIDPANYAGISMENVSFVEVRGFEVRGHNNSSGAGIRMANGAHSIRVIGNHVYDFPGNGIEAVEAGGVEIRNNRVHGNSRRSVWQTSGISLFQSKGPNGAGYDNVVSGNIVYDNINIVRSHANKITDGNCIIVDYMIRHDYQGDFLIENNVCANNGGRGVHVFHSSNVLARNNTLYRNLTHPEINDGELTAIEANNVTFENNLVISSSGARDIHFWRASNATANNNIIVGEKVDSSGGANPTIANAELTNPNLQPSATDFQPRAGSPVLEQSNGNTPVSDLRGVNRPRAASIGALDR